MSSDEVPAAPPKAIPGFNSKHEAVGDSASPVEMACRGLAAADPAAATEALLAAASLLRPARTSGVAARTTTPRAYQIAQCDASELMELVARVAHVSAYRLPLLGRHSDATTADDSNTWTRPTLTHYAHCAASAFALVATAVELEPAVVAVCPADVADLVMLAAEAVGARHAAGKLSTTRADLETGRGAAVGESQRLDDSVFIAERKSRMMDSRALFRRCGEVSSAVVRAAMLMLARCALLSEVGKLQLPTGRFAREAIVEALDAGGSPEGDSVADVLSPNGEAEIRAAVAAASASPRSRGRTIMTLSPIIAALIAICAAFIQSLPVVGMVVVLGVAAVWRIAARLNPRHCIDVSALLNTNDPHWFQELRPNMSRAAAVRWCAPSVDGSDGEGLVDASVSQAADPRSREDVEQAQTLVESIIGHVSGTVGGSGGATGGFDEMKVGEEASGAEPERMDHLAAVRRIAEAADSSFLVNGIKQGADGSVQLPVPPDVVKSLEELEKLLRDQGLEDAARSVASRLAFAREVVERAEPEPTA